MRCLGPEAGSVTQTESRDEKDAWAWPAAGLTGGVEAVGVSGGESKTGGGKVTHADSCQEGKDKSQGESEDQGGAGRGDARAARARAGGRR